MNTHDFGGTFNFIGGARREERKIPKKSIGTKFQFESASCINDH